MKKEAGMKFIKAGAGVLACVGIVVSPETIVEINAGFFGLYSVLSMVQGKFKKDDGK